MNTFKELGARAGVIGGGVIATLFAGLMLAGPASAQVSDPGLDAIEGLGSKVATYGAAIVAVVVISVGIMLGVKYLRKAVSKA